ncbi:MAG: aggregation factor core [Cyanobacteria bacterium P01_H01_bin.26]
MSDSVDNEDSAIAIAFIESAPKDRFVITNMGSCTLEELTLELDLSQSAGKLIFATTAAGAGVDVFQPFEVEEGDIVPLAAEGLNDGDTILALQLASLAPGSRASFTIDVDDTLPRSDLGQIRVADSEISGAVVTISAGDGETISAKFDSVAQVNLPVC